MPSLRHILTAVRLLAGTILLRLLGQLRGG